MGANYTGILPIKSLKLTVEVTKCYVRVLYQSYQPYFISVISHSVCFESYKNKNKKTCLC